jgi:hypothetical protein
MPDRIKRRQAQVHEKAVIDYLAEKVFEPPSAPEATKHAPTTDTGLPVEEQVRKEWDPRKGGLPILNK